MADGTHAVLKDHDGRWALCFERPLAHPPECVWQALTSAGELRDWHPTPFELEPRRGGRVSYLPGEGMAQLPQGTVLEFEPPRLLAHTWGEDQLRWELRPDAGGCVLCLTHIFDDRFKAARDGAGWHLCLRALSSALEADPRPQRGEGSHLPSEWNQLNREYEQRFAIAPEQATPPPSSQ